MLYVMNATIDDLSRHSRKVRKALKAQFSRKRLPKKFMHIVPGEGVLDELAGEPDAELVFHGGVLLNTKLYHALSVEFHYRNDSTRHLWGSPVTLEEFMPEQHSQAVALTDYLTNCLLCGDVPGVLLCPEMHCDALKTGGDNTDDRHRLTFLFEYPLFASQDFVKVAKAMLGFKPYRCEKCGARCHEGDRDVNECCQASHPELGGDQTCGGRCTEVPFSLDEVRATEPAASVG